MASDRPIIIIALSVFLLAALIVVIVLSVRLNNYECSESSSTSSSSGEDSDGKGNCVRNTTGLPYYGKRVGDLPTLDHKLRGTVYVLDDKRLRIRNLYYDGRAPAAFFWVGVKGISNDVVDTSGVNITNEHGTYALLLKYDNADITLTLPGNITVYNLKWFSMWCKRVEMSFGHVFFAPDYDVPRPRVIGQFQNSAGVSSGPITILDDKTVFIQQFTFDGNFSNAHFSGGNNGDGKNISAFLLQLDRLNGGLNALPRISGVNLTLVFPVGLSIFDVEYIGVYSDNQARNLIYVPTSLNVPANVKRLPT